MTKKDKQHFFDNKIKVVNTLHRYMDLDSDILTFNDEYDHWRHVLLGRRGGRW
jgi:hypothetical protein